MPVLLLSAASPPIVRAASRDVVARLLGAFAMHNVAMNEAANTKIGPEIGPHERAK